MVSLKEIKKDLIQTVIVTVLTVLSEKSNKPVEEIEINDALSAYEYSAEALIEIHEIFELEMNEEPQSLVTNLQTIEELINYLLNRLVDEKI
jgi:hypothetical protein